MSDAPTLIAVDPDRLARLEEAVARIEARLPEPDRRPWRTRAGMAAALGVSEATVTRWAQEGRLEARGSGSGRVFRERA